MNALTWQRLVYVLILLSMPLSTANSKDFDNSTLDKIRAYGAIYVGHHEASVPFSYFFGKEVVGYSIDLCKRVVDAVRAELGDPALPVVLVPLTSANRFWMLHVGNIDLECGSATNTKIRQQSMAFGVTTFVSGVKAVTRKDSGIDRIGDLDGKVVVTVSGTTNTRVVNRVLATYNASSLAKTARTHSEALAMVVSGEADAFVLDDALLAGVVANSAQSDQVKLMDENFGLEPYSIVFRRDDPKFKKLVDGALIKMMKSGEMEKLYNKWFMSPIPPNSINLKMPISDRLRDLFRNPDDTGI
ncbi:MAG: amino acid ABC transporter substrate-binding protein [Sulfuritalea sp.]|nr:amino acid ABC transporter substrate-binding protein [Sulfuritalea sp.]